MAASSAPPDPTCSTCGAPRLAADTFCRTCGAAVASEAAIAPEPSGPSTLPTKESEPTSPAPPVAAEPARRTWLTLAVVVLALGAIGLLAFRSAGDDAALGDFRVASTVDTTTTLPTLSPATPATSTVPVVPATATTSTTTPPTTTSSTTSTTTTTTTTTSTTTTTTPPTTTTTTATATTTTGTVPDWEPGFFPTPGEAIADWLQFLELPYAGTCEALAGREAEIGGTVLCSQFMEDLVPAQIHVWGVFATDDFGGWLLIDAGSAGWSIADESFEYERPPW